MSLNNMKEPPNIMAKNGIKKLSDIDKGVDKLNFWFIINTIFTILAGVATVTLAILAYIK